tara:strand:+ start:149 stop:709 length:561 start_codon:yes stop_codon:yes gene_type:complete
MLIVVFLIFVISVNSNLIIDSKDSNKKCLQGDILEIYVRPYSVFNRQIFINRFFPHVAVDVKKCYSMYDTYHRYCEIFSYGKLSNGKVYSPDILTVGRNCTNKKCKSVTPGYNKEYLTENWIIVKNKDAFNKYIEASLNKNTGYNLIFNNCMKWSSNLIKASNNNTNFSCSILGISLPFALPYICK